MAAAARAPVAVVTGANTGIGFHVAGQLAARGYDVIMACRSEARGQEAVRRLKEQYGAGASAELRLLDLASFASVRAFASGLAAAGRGPLELLVCNAGLNSASVPKEPEAQLTEDGADLVYQTNFLSHLLLVLLLLPLLGAAAGRVLSVTSVVHRGAEPEHLGLARRVREPYVSLYGLSKLAQIAGTRELHRRFGKARGVAFHCVNPGGVASDIWRAYPGWQRWAFSALLARAETAAETVVQACVCEEGRAPAEPFYWNGYMGAERLSLFEYWSPVPARDRLVPSEPSDAARDAALAAKVWEEGIAAFRAAGIDVTDDGELAG